jgi:hypothetical protein
VCGNDLRVTYVGIWPELRVRGLLGRALLPGLEVRQKHPLQTIAKRPTDAEHCRKVVAPRTGHELTLVGRTGDLVQVATDVPKHPHRCVGLPTLG